MTEPPATPPEPEDTSQADDGLVEPAAELKPALEAVLMVTDQPLDHLTLAQAVGHPPQQVERALTELAEEYTADGRGFDLRSVGGGWRFYTREEYAPIVEKYVLDGQQARLTQAALETLAVVAYRQPVSRGRVSAVRGVNVDGVMRTLLTRGLVEEAGQDSETGAVLYRTTSYFLERMGLDSVEDLPPLAPLLPDTDEMDEMGELEGDRARPERGSSSDTGAQSSELATDAEATDAEATDAEATDVEATDVEATDAEATDVEARPRLDA
jgi:segregation and condensation protein B